jgi:DNA polymerase elongation subunit (family B)
MFQNIYITSRSDDEPATVYLWDDEKGLLTFPYSDYDYCYKLDRSGTHETIYGDRVSKTFHYRDGQPGIFESDVPRETRVLTDIYLDDDSVSKNHRTLFFDIEVSSIGGFASTTKANKEITAIACYDEANDRELMFLWDMNNVMTIRTLQVGKCKVQGFDTEQEMLTAFMDFYTELKPTNLVGWNSNQYDIPYLYNRLSNVFDADTANMLSPIGIVRYNKYRSRYQIAGVNCLDYIEMYQKFTYNRKPSYRLHNIGLAEVNLGKVEYTGTLDDLFANDLSRFIEYNLRDVHIVVKIDQKMKLIDLVKNISHVGHTQYDDYPYSSKYIEGTILTYLHRNNKVAPNKRVEGRAEFEERLEDDEEGFSGAFVQPPMPGLYEWVFNLDLQSLYPSIIMSLNISPETKIGYVKNWNLAQHLASKNGQYIISIGNVENVVNYDQFVQFMNDEKFMLSSNGILYRSDKVGVIPEILNKWFSERLEYKKLQKEHKKSGNAELADYYDRRQHVQKILLNSIYGVLGLPIFRFYDLDNASAVTTTGQDIIKTSAKFVSRKYIGMGAEPRTDAWLRKYTVILKKEIKKGRLNPSDVPYLMDPENLCIYIDTDSVYFTIMPFLTEGQDPKEFTIRFAREREVELNKFYDVMAKRMMFCDNHRLVIKGEAVNSTSFWAAKKRYAMLQVHDLEAGADLKESKMKIKGLDVISKVSLWWMLPFWNSGNN